ncbi:hypothetical protein MAR_002108, partial [Mya arenaria]
MGVFDSPEAQNWLRQWLAVFITREAILPVVKSEASHLHTDILGALQASVCSQDHGRITDTSILSCRFHDEFRDEIKRRHKQRPSWKNATTDTWHNDAFSIAKLFMQPSGYDDKTNFDQIDFNGIAAFMFNCRRFPAAVQSSSDQLKTILPELVGDHWKSIIEGIATKCLQDIHDLSKDEKHSWRIEADKKRADFQFLGDSIMSNLASSSENALCDIKKTLEVSLETIANSIKNGIDIIEEYIVKGERKIDAKTEKGERNLSEMTETGKRNISEKTIRGERKIEQKTEIAEREIEVKTELGTRTIYERTKLVERRIEKKTEIGERKIEEKTDIGERKIEEKTKKVEQEIDAKISLLNEKRGNLTKAVSLHIYGDAQHISNFANSIDSNALDLENYTSLKYLHLQNLHYKDVTGLNLYNLRECDIEFHSWHGPTAQHLIHTFYHCDIDSLKNIKTLKLSNVKGFAFLRQVPEQKEHLDLRGLENFTNLGLSNLAYSDVVNLQTSRLHYLRLKFNELQRAPQLMSTLSTHGTYQ